MCFDPSRNIDYYLSPVKTRGYRVELVRLSVCLSLRLSVRLSRLMWGTLCTQVLVWRSWARGFKFYTLYKPRSEVRPRQGFIWICWKLSILEHFNKCRFQTFFQMSSTLCGRVCSEAIELELSNFTRINQGLKSCLVKVSSGAVANCRFWNN